MFNIVIIDAVDGRESVLELDFLISINL